jgi:pimeloyl-ACP methyl ester carboxylesterase
MRRINILARRCYSNKGSDGFHQTKAYSSLYRLQELDFNENSILRKLFFIDEHTSHADLTLPPILMLGGTAQTVNSYLPHIQAIRKKRRLIIPELRGQGQTTLDTDYCTMDRIIEDLNDFTDRLGLKHFYLSGFSFGGRVAMAFTAKYPSKVLKLSVTGIPAARPLYGKMIIQSWEDALSRGNIRDCAWSFLINGYSEDFISKHYTTLVSFIDIIVAANNPGRLYDLIRLSHAAKDDDPFSVKSSAGKITCPVQLITARYDRIAGHQPCLDLAQYLKTCEVETMETGHLAPFEDPATWREHVLRFFR